MQKKQLKDYSHIGENNYIFESSNPMVRRGDINSINGNIVKGRHWAYRPINKETGDVIKQITPEMIKDIYKVDPNGELYKKNNMPNSADSQEK